jgi:hypothetical protein
MLCSSLFSQIYSHFALSFLDHECPYCKRTTAFKFMPNIIGVFTIDIWAENVGSDLAEIWVDPEPGLGNPLGQIWSSSTPFTIEIQMSLI